VHLTLHDKTVNCYETGLCEMSVKYSRLLHKQNRVFCKKYLKSQFFSLFLLQHYLIELIIKFGKASHAIKYILIELVAPVVESVITWSTD